VTSDICCFELFPFNYAQNDIFISFLTQRSFFLKFLPLIEFTTKTYKILFPPPSLKLYCIPCVLSGGQCLHKTSFLLLDSNRTTFFCNVKYLMISFYLHTIFCKYTLDYSPMIIQIIFYFNCG
jgi:hypothetical protein